MADKKIEDATRVSSVTGTEILPASVSSAAKSLTTEQVKDYVIEAIKALSLNEDWDGSVDDKILMKFTSGSSYELKYVTFDDIILYVYDVFFKSYEVAGSSALDDTCELIVNIGDDEAPQAERLSIANLVAYLEANHPATFSIHSLTAADTANATDEIAAYQTSAAANRKVTVSQLADVICGQTAGKATERSTAIDSTDYLLIGEPSATTGEPPILKKVLFGTSGISTANKVVAPNANTANKIPQWNGDNSKRLKDGLTLTATSTSGGETVSNINENSGNDEVPSSAAVYNYGLEATENLTVAPASNNDGYVPKWSGSNSKTLSNGFAVVTSVGATGDDTSLATEKAVRTAITNAVADRVVSPSTTTSGKIPQWDGSNSKTLKDGVSLVTSVGATGSNTSVPTEKAVRDAITDGVSGLVSYTKDTIIADDFSYLPTSGYSKGDMYHCRATIGSEIVQALFMCIDDTDGVSSWAYVGKLLSTWPTA